MTDETFTEKFLENVVIAVVVAACFSAFLSENFRYNADHWIANIYEIKKWSLYDSKVKTFLLGVFEPIFDIFGFVLILYLYWKHRFQNRSFFSNLIILTLLAFWPKITFHFVMIFFDVSIQWYHIMWPIVFGLILILGFIPYKKEKRAEEKAKIGAKAYLIIVTYTIGGLVLALNTWQFYWALLQNSGLSPLIMAVRSAIYPLTVAQIYIIILQLLFTRQNALKAKIYQKIRDYLTPEEYRVAFLDSIGKIPWQIVLISLILDLFIV